MLGIWKNYDELEESLCMDELTATYNTIVEDHNEEQKFQAQIAGAELAESETTTEQAESDGTSFVDRMEQRKQQNLEQQAKEGGSEAFFGTGYRVIGG